VLTTLRSRQGGLDRLDQPAPGSWLHVTAPGQPELAQLAAFGVPAALLDHVGDPDERPRVEHSGDVVLIVLHYAMRRGVESGVPFVTAPLSVVLTPRGVVTVAPREVSFLEPLLEGRVAGLDTSRPTDFLLRLFWQLADDYLAGMREINGAVERLEDELKRSLRNEEVLGLLDYQKSLTYFATGLRANEIALERLRHVSAMHWESADQELLADVLVELRQAIEMADISDNILSQMMDAFASIVSNNLNSVMKVLTSVTIIIAIPTLIASIYGMNVGLPGAHSRLAFGAIVALCVLLGVLLVVVFRRRNWL
jgi:magnesium transporter